MFAPLGVRAPPENSLVEVVGVDVVVVVADAVRQLDTNSCCSIKEP